MYIFGLQDHKIDLNIGDRRNLGSANTIKGLSIAFKPDSSRSVLANIDAAAIQV